MLTSRYKSVLSAIIADYLSSAEPIGSKAVASRLDKSLSPATIRQVMSGLMEMGLLSQPHSSAGRIPTVNGLKYFVENVLEVSELGAENQNRIRQHYKSINEDEFSLPSILQKTSKFLSTVSKYAGLVVAPREDGIVVRHMEFIPLGLRRVLGIFVTPQGQIYNRLLDLEEDYTYSELEKLSNYCNESFIGLSLSNAKKKISEELKSQEMDYDKMIRKALLFSELIFDEVQDEEILIDGETNLFSQPEFCEGEKIKELLSMMEEKRRILHLIEMSDVGRGIRFFIGAESDKVGNNVGLISAEYTGRGKVLGTVGVIGPARMDYGRVIPLVNFTAKLISDLIINGKVG